jgi:hypothetical protein
MLCFVASMLVLIAFTPRTRTAAGSPPPAFSYILLSALHAVCYAFLALIVRGVS